MANDSGRARLRLGLLTAQPDANGCLRYMGGKDADGYGLFWLDGKTRRAHQVAWELANGAVWPTGLVARHACGVRDCLNPQHVQPGTPKENRMDRERNVTLLQMAEQALAGEDDTMDASGGGEDLTWLVAQLACWPTRVDESCTTNMRFLMNSAARTLMSLAALRTPLKCLEIQE